MLPSDFSFDWSGTSYQEKRSSGTSTFALGLAVIMVFLILAAQYEKWSLPLSVLMAMPFGIVRRARWPCTSADSTTTSISRSAS